MPPLRHCFARGKRHSIRKDTSAEEMLGQDARVAQPLGGKKSAMAFTSMKRRPCEVTFASLMLIRIYIFLVIFPVFNTDDLSCPQASDLLQWDARMTGRLESE